MQIRTGVCEHRHSVYSASDVGSAEIDSSTADNSERACDRRSLLSEFSLSNATLLHYPEISYTIPVNLVCILITMCSVAHAHVSSRLAKIKEVMRRSTDKLLLSSVTVSENLKRVQSVFSP